MDGWMVVGWKGEEMFSLAVLATALAHSVPRQLPALAALSSRSSSLPTTTPLTTCSHSLFSPPSPSPLPSFARAFSLSPTPSQYRGRFSKSKSTPAEPKPAPKPELSRSSRLAFQNVSIGRSILVQSDNPVTAYMKLREVVDSSRLRDIVRRQREYEKPTDFRRRKKKEAKHRFFLRVLSEKVRLAHLLKKRWVSRRGVRDPSAIALTEAIAGGE
ncbi:hypothetical protein M427DRAFT_29025 [Gonapodya prolifera JEL478]|uniref:Ribosomal protein S21 n=1 Tax=Gonapodya prolifera (strain JEL478) TaxID=1344416 RepID=A0A139AS87_GONPJ|nr:hypothetical protein M427DRAFT_29025 [Gonapodya prolifera JEL478]|eukprot:KXS19597.1 hypothetical protein M427DRAFT_29025 [Gonapodya prolifera JEL478]